MKTQNTLLFALICGAVWSTNAVDLTRMPAGGSFQALREKIDWDFFKSEPNHMKTIHNPTQGVSHGQNQQLETVDQADEERKSDPGQDAGADFEFVGDEAISTDEYDNQTGSHNASLLGTFNEVASSFTSYVYNRADNVRNKMNRMIDVAMDRDLKKEEARKLEVELETEKLKSLLALQEREKKNTNAYTEELKKQLELQKKENEQLEQQNEQLRSQQSEMYPTVDKEELQWIEEDAQAQQSTIIDEFHDMTKKGLESIEALMREMRVSSDEEESDEEESHEQDNKTKETVVQDMQLSDDTTQAQSKEQRRKERKKNLDAAFAKKAQKQNEESKDAQE